VNRYELKEAWDVIVNGIAISCLTDQQSAAFFMAGDREMAKLYGLAALGDVASALASALGTRRADKAFAPVLDPLIDACEKQIKLHEESLERIRRGKFRNTPPGRREMEIPEHWLRAVEAARTLYAELGGDPADIRDVISKVHELQSQLASPALISEN